MERQRLATKTTRIGSLKTISADISTGSLKTPNSVFPQSNKQPENHPA
ncbi:hypothetical protein [Kingella oralis]|nr:hypothetical protein [Kingella oralis]